jgi:uncharacterized protein (DUF58 family)
VRSLISQSIMPLAFLSAGPLADIIFNPMLQPGGGLAISFIGRLVGVGQGRGIGLIFVISGFALILVTLWVAASPRIRRIETDLPDVIVEVSAPAPEAVEA